MNSFSYDQNSIKSNLTIKKKQLNLANNCISNKNQVFQNVLSERNSKSESLKKYNYQNNCFLPKNFTVNEKYIFLEINETKLLKKIKEQIELLSGYCITNSDITENDNLTVSLIVTDNTKTIKNIAKKELNIFLPSSLSKIKNVNNIPICPGHYFHNFLTTQLKKKKEICKLSISSNIIFLSNNFIKIQQRQNVEKIKYYQRDVIDDFIKLNVFNDHLISAFTKKKTKNLKYNKNKKFLKLEGYCEFCKVQTLNRFTHCEETYHKYHINLNKKLFDELDKEIGFFDGTFKKELLFIIPF